MSIWNFGLALNEPIQNCRSQKGSILLQIGLINTEILKSEAKLAKICLIIEHDKLNQSSKQEISWTDFKITVTHLAEIFITTVTSSYQYKLQLLAINFGSNQLKSVASSNNYLLPVATS